MRGRAYIPEIKPREEVIVTRETFAEAYPELYREIQEEAFKKGHRTGFLAGYEEGWPVGVAEARASVLHEGSKRERARVLIAEYQRVHHVPLKDAVLEIGRRHRELFK